VSPPSDVIVIGAGIVGCAIAHELASRGASVQVIDHRPVGMGATQASAGILAPYIEAREGTPLLGLAVRSLDLYDDFVSRVAHDSGAVIPYRRTGTLDIALDERDLRALSATAEVLARLRVPASLVDAAAARSEEPHVSASVVGALLVEAHGFVAASDLTRALAAAAGRSGARLFESSRVRRIAPRDGAAVVEMDNGSLTCGAVVLAAGSWSGGVDIAGIGVRPPVRPVRGQLLSLAWEGAPLRRVTWSSRCYLVPWEDGTVLVGATVEEVGFDERATVAGVRDLLDAASQVAPYARSAGFNAARVGLRPATPDGLPIVGRSSVMPNLVYATGHFRNGVLLAPLTARLVADVLLENRLDPMLAPLAPARFGAL
jgi:glycine oxidase